MNKELRLYFSRTVAVWIMKKYLYCKLGVAESWKSLFLIKNDASIQCPNNEVMKHIKMPLYFSGYLSHPALMQGTITQCQPCMTSDLYYRLPAQVIESESTPCQTQQQYPVFPYSPC